MGGAVSAGINNDELVDNLVAADYIKTVKVEEIFRAVDRGDFYIQNYRENAYHDMAWKHDHIHISAPCIYSEVMEALSLRPGVSFLNIGSGTGYLSTMAGLMLGCNGINHGIEIHEDVVQYAQERVENFMKASPAFDRYSFCEPEFVIGNCLDLSPDVLGYDRIYCGAGCPIDHKSFLTNLLNINGILVVPLSDQLQAITRTGQTTFESKTILPVNFATLVIPQEPKSLSLLPSRGPPLLQAICRACIRRVISEKYHSGSNRKHRKRKKTNVRVTRNSKSTKELLSDSSSDSEDSDDDKPDAAGDRCHSPQPVGTSSNNNESSNHDLNVERRRNLLLNVMTNTVMSVRDTKTQDTSTSNAPASSNQEQMDVQNSSSDSGKSEKQKNEAKTKRVKRSFNPFLRLRHRSRKTTTNTEGTNVESAEKIRKVTNPTTNQNDSNTTNTTDATNATHVTTTTTNIDIRVDSDAICLYSFLNEMTDRRRGSSGPSSILLESVGDRNSSRKRDTSSESEGYETDDLNPSLQAFRNAILDLPVPNALSCYLLYYR
nr:protein-L-isoaspartate O-methyltransferase domain-containing protein 1 isoform X2 [Ciona intestinalis]|eukprot:XP_002121608.3 protein-L-isoaspartate O-methyltransferase domain-containing protein 1 isoform X2 [Ciona intestinalis]